MRNAISRPRRFFTVAASPILLLLIAVAFAACGDDPGGGDNATASADKTDGGSGSTAGTSAEEQQIEKLVVHLRDLYNGRNGKEFCANITAHGQREILNIRRRFPKVSSNGCADFVVIFGSRQHHIQKPVRMLKMAVNGDKATATFGGGIAGVLSVATFKFSKVDGKWKLDNPISGAKTRRLASNAP
jgi:hypothetical protein